MSARAGAAVIATVVAAAVAIDAGGAPGPEAGPELAAAGLNAGQLAGQRVIASYRGPRPPDRLLRMIRAGRIAGVIFFEENVASRRKLATVAGRLQRVHRNSELPPELRDTPLLLMADQEGGLVRRLPGAPRRSQLEIGRASRPLQAASNAGGGAGKNLSRSGLNVNLAPVLDVSRGADGALEHTGRTYGRRAGKVGRLAAAFIAAQAEHGVAAGAKHFPGLGPASVTTDDAAVRISTRRRRLRRIDEAPYEPAIAAGVGVVMLSNATYPAFGRRPAVFSRRIIEAELRDRLGFDGVTITDALEVPGLAAFGPVAKRGLRAAGAGADLLLFASRRTGDAEAGRRRLARAIRSGRLDREGALVSAARVLDLRDDLGF